MNDRLDQAKAAVREVHDLQFRINELEQRLSGLKTELYVKLRKELPDLFFEVGVDKVGIPANGNEPAYDAILKPYVKFLIPTSWDDERKNAAFDWLEDHGAATLIKTKIGIEVDRQDYQLARKLRETLDKMKIQYESNLSVHHGTLTSWAKDQLARHVTLPLDVLGGDVGQVVELKQRKT